MPEKSRFAEALEDLTKYAQYRAPGNNYGHGHMICEIPVPHYETIKYALDELEKTNAQNA